MLSSFGQGHSQKYQTFIASSETSKDTLVAFSKVNKIARRLLLHKHLSNFVGFFNLGVTSNSPQVPKYTKDNL